MIVTKWYGGGGGSTFKKTQKPKPKLGISGNVGFFWVFLEKGVKSTFLDIPDSLRPTYFLNFFIGISSGSDA